MNAGSPAEEAGLRVYDKIVQINKQPTDTMQNHQAGFGETPISINSKHQEIRGLTRLIRCRN